MVDFALDVTTCRKLAFDAYFGDPAQVVASYAPSTAPAACGHCDNCLRANAATRECASSDQESNSQSAAAVNVVVVKDVTVEAWKICKILQATDAREGKLTLSGAADLARGLQKGSFARDQKLPNGKTERVKETLDIDQVCGGKIMLNNDVSKAWQDRLCINPLMQYTSDRRTDHTPIDP